MRPERSPEPFVGRYVQADFWPPKNGGWQFPFHQISQNDFLPPSPNFKFIRQRSCKLDNSVIQEGWPNFEGLSHAHPIHLLEQIIRKIVLLIEGKIPAQMTFLHWARQGLPDAIFYGIGRSSRQP